MAALQALICLLLLMAYTAESGWAYVYYSICEDKDCKDGCVWRSLHAVEGYCYTPENMKFSCEEFAYNDQTAGRISVEVFDDKTCKGEPTVYESGQCKTYGDGSLYVLYTAAELCDLPTNGLKSEQAIATSSDEVSHYGKYFWGVVITVFIVCSAGAVGGYLVYRFRRETKSKIRSNSQEPPLLTTQ